MAKLEARNIVKYFQHDDYKLKALGGVSLKIQEGDLFVLLDLLDVVNLHFLE